MAKKKSSSNSVVVTTESSISEKLAIAPVGSDLNRSTALDAKVSKADMVNVIKQQVLDSMDSDINEFKKTISKLEKELKEVIEKDISIIKKAIVKSYKKEHKLELNIDNITHRYEISDISNTVSITFSYILVTSDTLFRNDISNDIKATIDSKISHLMLGRSYTEKSSISINIPDVYYKTDNIEKFNKNVKNLYKILEDKLENNRKITSTDYLRAKLDIGILAGTTNGEQVVQNIKKLADKLIEQNISHPSITE